MAATTCTREGSGSNVQDAMACLPSAVGIVPKTAAPSHSRACLRIQQLANSVGNASLRVDRLGSGCVRVVLWSLSAVEHSIISYEPDPAQAPALLCEGMLFVLGRRGSGLP
jgi:hypothetical protein